MTKLLKINKFQTKQNTTQQTQRPKKKKSITENQISKFPVFSYYSISPLTDTKPLTLHKNFLYFSFSLKSSHYFPSLSRQPNALTFSWFLSSDISAPKIGNFLNFHYPFHSFIHSFIQSHIFIFSYFGFRFRILIRPAVGYNKIPKF